MIYREYFLIRRTLAWFAAALAAIMLLGLAGHLINLNATGIGHSSIDVSGDAGWMTVIVASVLGVALGNGSRQPARVLWMVPIPRWKIALQIIAADLVGTTVAFGYAYAIMLLLLALAFPHFTLQMVLPVNVAGVLAALAMLYAVYGCSSLVGMLGRRMGYFGLAALPVLMIWMMAAQSGDVLGAALRAPIVANPFAVFNAGIVLKNYGPHPLTLDPATSSLQWLSASWTTPILVASAVATLGLAVALWQRADAL